MFQQRPAGHLIGCRVIRGDAIGIQRTVEEVAAEMELTLPEGVEVQLIRTRAEAITGRLNILMDNGLMGLGLVACGESSDGPLQLDAPAWSEEKDDSNRDSLLATGQIDLRPLDGYDQVLDLRRNGCVGSINWVRLISS